MHMAILYYVICVGGTLVASILYMNKYWTKEKLEKLIKGESD